ncbi:unnamed protein product [Mesocestoides corti]|uniref:Btz domain-containing protein n=1 Tax=Mesocestoides corti TaxID=53468 RepID=A0A0R3UAV7_MESCO|nr:unnamed protein product [Mesocestoides corti]
MSEGEVDDEEEEVEDEGRTERTNHEKSHHGPTRHSHPRQHIGSRSSSHRHQLKPPAQHRNRRQPVSSHDRRRNANDSTHSSMLTAKRARRRSDEREGYTRTRYSSPPPPARRPRTHRAPIVNGTSSTRRNRFSSSSGKFADVMVARGRLAPAFTSHRSGAVGVRNGRRPPTQRSFAQRR